jgi:tetratricopeptide (TPR) repeat protein
VLERVCAEPEGRFLERVDEATVARVVAEVPGARGRMRFAHVLVRDALYDRLGAARRARLHHRVGEALEALYARDPGPHLAELAHHFLEASAADEANKAIDYAKRAGDRAASQLAHEEAVRHYTSALHALDATGSGDADRTCELQLALGEALSRAGRGQEAKEVLRRAATLAERTGRTDRLARAAIDPSRSPRPRCSPRRERGSCFPFARSSPSGSGSHHPVGRVGAARERACDDREAVGFTRRSERRRDPASRAKEGADATGARYRREGKAGHAPIPVGIRSGRCLSIVNCLMAVSRVVRPVR